MRVSFLAILGLLSACKSNVQHEPTTSGTTLKTIHVPNLTDTLTTDADLNSEWLKLDKENFNNILSLLDNQSALNNQDQFINSIIKLDIRETKDLGFGLTYFECAQYGGYVTTWINLVAFKNVIIQYEISYSKEDFQIIDYLIKRDPKMRNEISYVVDSTARYSFSYLDSLTFDEFKTNVASELGPIKLSSSEQDNEFYSNYSILTSPFNSYDYGTTCYYSGVEPEGRTAINYFVSSNNVETIREIMKGYNPEGRLYAIEALLTAVKEKKATLTEQDKVSIKRILALKIPISTCSGCMVSTSTADDLLDEKLKELIR